MTRKARPIAAGSAVPSDRRSHPAGLTNDPSGIELALRERVKELECLYAISRLRETHLSSADRFLQSVVDRLPATWQFPEHAAARIVYGDRQYVSNGFRKGPWRMAAEVRIDDSPVGAVEVFYDKEVPAPPGGPFLKEEHSLLRVVGERVSSTLTHMKAEAELRDAHKALRGQHQALQEANIALKAVLSRLEDEKNEIRAAVLANIQKLVMPIISELEQAATGRQRSCVALLRQSLQEIASPFLTELARNHLELTPVEIAISTMIRNGLSTEEIARFRRISPATVRRHRENIRRKLGLRNRAVNLVTYLQAARSGDGGAATDRGALGRNGALPAGMSPVPARSPVEFRSG